MLFLIFFGGFDFFFCKIPFNRSCVHILPLFIFNFTSKHCIIWKFNKQKLIFPLTQWNWFVTPEIFKLNFDLPGNLEFIELGRDLFVTWEMSIYYKIIKITIFCIPSAVNHKIHLQISSHAISILCNVKTKKIFLSGKDDLIRR